MVGRRLRAAIAALCFSGLLFAQEAPERPSPAPRVSRKRCARTFAVTEPPRPVHLHGGVTERRLDAKGGRKKARVRLRGLPSYEPGKVYRRLVARDGVRLTEAELAEQDRKQEEKTEKREKRRSSEDAAEREKRLEERRLREQRVVDESSDGRDRDRRARDRRRPPSRDRGLHAEARYKPVTKGGRSSRRSRARLDRRGRPAARPPGGPASSTNMGVGPGASPVSRADPRVIPRRKVNGEIWLPAEASFTGAAKLSWCSAPASRCRRDTATTGSSRSGRTSRSRRPRATSSVRLRADPVGEVSQDGEPVHRQDGNLLSRGNHLTVAARRPHRCIPFDRHG